MECNNSSYTLLSKDSLSLNIDSLGFDNLADNVVELLNDDLNYQIRSIIQKSYDFMRMSKRKKLTTDDINKALDVSNIKRLYGHGCQDSNTLYHEIKSGELYVAADDTLSLNMILDERTNLHIQPNPTPNISSCWLNISPERSLKRPEIIQSSNFDLKFNCENYLLLLKESIESNNKELFQEICKDIKSNPNISLILLNLIICLQTEMNSCSNTLYKVSLLLQVIETIISNQYLFLDIQPHLKLLISIPCKSMLCDMTSYLNCDNVDAYIIIHKASYLTYKIIRLWGTSYNGLQSEYENELSLNLINESTSLMTLYSVFLSIFYLGYNAVRIFAFPRMNLILEKIEPFLLNNTTPTYQQKLQANQLRGLILVIFEVFLRHNLQTKSEKSIICPLVYATLYETYSDSLATRIPILHNCAEKSIRLEKTAEPTMKIKSCVGEGSTGIKLTILTKPKANAPRTRNDVVKIKVRQKLQQVFDVVQVRSRRDALFVLKLRGRQHLCTFTERRKAQILQRNMALQHAAVSRYRSIVAKLHHKTNSFKMSKISRILPFDFSNIIL